MWRREVGLFVAACIVVSVILMVGNNHWQRLMHRTAPVPTGTGPDYSHAPATWTGRQACAECHAEADSVWTGSDHDLAMQLPRPETITADFNNATYTHYGVTSTFYRDGEKYMVRTDGPDGKLTDFEVAYVFGYFPLEQFLIRFPDGRMQSLNVCWDTTPAADGGLIAVFGSAGDRDPSKREPMGRAAGQRCRLVIITDEDPRGEDRTAILEGIAAGAETAGKRRGQDLLVVADRAEAIGEALRRARPGDAVLLAGKGHERTIEMADGELPWDEAAVTRAALRARRP